MYESVCMTMYIYKYMRVNRYLYAYKHTYLRTIPALTTNSIIIKTKIGCIWADTFDKF